MGPNHIERSNPQSQKQRAVWRPPAELCQMAREESADFMNGLFRAFREEASSRIDGMTAAVLKGDTGRIRGEAHSLKGSSAQIGARELAALCQRMEQLADQEFSPGTLPLLQEIRDAFALVCQRLDDPALCDELTHEETGI
jgi:HPt (histidine-containing phosphotransfer) domain-containing protein